MLWTPLVYNFPLERNQIFSWQTGDADGGRISFLTAETRFFFMFFLSRQTHIRRQTKGVHHHSDRSFAKKSNWSLMKWAICFVTPSLKKYSSFNVLYRWDHQIRIHLSFRWLPLLDPFDAFVIFVWFRDQMVIANLLCKPLLFLLQFLPGFPATGVTPPR